MPLPDPDKSFLEIVRAGPVQPGHVLGGDGSARHAEPRHLRGPVVARDLACPPCSSGSRSGAARAAGRLLPKTVDTVLTTVFNVLLSIPALVPALALVAIFASAQDGKPNGRKSAVLIAPAIVTVPLIGRIARASARRGPARVRQGRRGIGRPATCASSGARCCPTCCRPWCPSPCSESRWRSWPRAAWPCSASASPRCRRGNMIAFGRSDLARAPHIVAVPSIAIFLTVLALNYLGDVVRARFDVREAAPEPRRVAGRLQDQRARLRAPPTSPTCAPGSAPPAASCGPSTACRSPSTAAAPSASWASRGRASRCSAVDHGPAAQAQRRARGARRLRRPGHDRAGPEGAAQPLGRAEMSMVFQDPMTALNPVLKIGNQITEGLRHHLGVDRKTANENAVALLRSVGIPEPERRLSQYPHELSGGMRQRDDRSGPRLRAQAAVRRRAHDRPGRDRPGADPQPAGPPAASGTWP